jgi:hypothetical protein
MTKLEQIEHDITSLSPEELSAFREWFDAFDVAAWDARIEADSKSGKLDRLRDQALAAHRDGETTAL